MKCHVWISCGNEPGMAFPLLNSRELGRIVIWNFFSKEAEMKEVLEEDPWRLKNHLEVFH